MAYAEKRGKGEYPWRGRYLKPDGTYGSIPGFATKVEAKKAAEDMESDVRHGRWIDPAIAATPIDDFRPRWIAAQNYAPNTIESYDQHWERHGTRRWGHIGIGQVDPLEMQTWLKELRARSPAAATIMRAQLTGMFDTAVFMRMIHFSPIPPAELTGGRARPDAIPRSGAIPTRDEYAEILRRMPTWRDVMMVIEKAFTGKRYSELAAGHRGALTLTPPDRETNTDARGHCIIDPQTGAVHFDKHGDPFLGPPKSGDRRSLEPGLPPGRLMDYPPFLALLLAAYLDALPASQNLLYANTIGTWQDDNVWRAGPWGRAVKGRDGDRDHIPLKPIRGGDLVPHDLKHLNKAIMNDKRVHEVMQHYVLGHKMRGSSEPYQHPTPKMRAERVQALQETWEEWDIDLSRWGVKADRWSVDMSGLTIPLQPRRRRSPNPLPVDL